MRIVKGHNLNQSHLNIMIEGKLFKQARPTELFAPILGEVTPSKNRFGDNRQRLWTYDTEASIYRDIHRLILENRMEEAELALSALPLRTAHWYYLNGMVLWGKGRYAEAYDSLQQAVSLAPGNREYIKALDYILQAYHPLTALYFQKRLFEKIPPWVYVIFILFMVWLISRIV